jgi:hypothetical protein
MFQVSSHKNYFKRRRFRLKRIIFEAGNLSGFKKDYIDLMIYFLAVASKEK